MNEQERLQRVTDILADNAHEMCALEGDNNDIILDANMDGVQMVAKEIAAIFKQPQKDTRSRRERALDAEFERMGAKPMVYHFLNIGGFKAVTVAQIALRGQEGWGGYTYDYRTLMRHIQNCESNASVYPSITLLYELKNMEVYGVAICNQCDVFSRRYGRNKAKGKLWQHLLKEAQKE